MSMYIYLVLGAMAVGLSSVYSDESWLNEELKSLESECLKKFELTDEDIEAVMKTGDVSKIDPCYWGCYFKKIGLINAKGQYDLDLTVMKTFWKSDNFTALEELGSRCASVKDEAVKDGEAGCERGALLAACFMLYDD